VSERDAPAVTRPASVGQRLLWMMDHYGSNPGALNVPVIYRLNGPLDMSALRGALRDLGQRHESLRTTFAWSGRRLTQQIAGPADVPVEEVDAAGLTPGQLEDEARRRQREAIDVSTSPLRVTVLHGDGDSHVLLFNIHHLVTDAWSNRLLSRDLAALYSARRTGVPAVLPPVTWQFRQFQDWQDANLNAGRMSAHYEFWQSHLAGAQFARLPKPDGAGQARRESGVLRFDLPAPVTAHLRQLARTHRTTLYTVLLGAFYHALAQVTGKDDLTIGSLFANRARTQVQDTVGFFVNMLALRERVLPGEPLGGVLDRARVTVARAVEHQEVPCQVLPLSAQPQGGGAVHDVVFHMLATPPLASGEPRWDGLESESLHLLALLSSRFDLELVIVPVGGQLAGLVRYATGACDPALAAQLADAYQAVIQPAAATASAAAARLAASAASMSSRDMAAQTYQ
jgi:hypothetical protein